MSVRRAKIGKLFWTMLAAGLCLLWPIACGSGGKDANRDDEEIADEGDDLVVPPDDDDSSRAPQISDAFWEPDPAEPDPCHASHYPLSSLFFHVCDPDDDLAGGKILGRMSGSNEWFWQEGAFTWEFVIEQWPQEISPADDCRQPILFYIPTWFFATGQATRCIDLIVTDGAGHKSNRLKNICVRMPPGW